MQNDTNASSVRLDKWLWAARFFKQRGLARAAVQAGKVHYNGQRTKPAKMVELGATIELPRGYDRIEITVIGLSEKRGNATQAATLYEETSASINKREANAQARRLNSAINPHPEQRPTKKQRRALIKFKYQ